MNFIETLKSVGGVKPCNPCGYANAPVGPMPCSKCHGTGEVLDLTPLLAKPKELMSAVDALVLVANQLIRGSDIVWTNYLSMQPKLHVIGPQRASNLVYEIARQLGGTAVTCFDHDAETKHNLNAWANCECTCPACKRDMLSFVASYRLLPIPDNATCLFVTDRVNIEEMLAIEQAVGKCNALPYLLALVSSVDIWKNELCKVICLHKEKA